MRYLVFTRSFALASLWPSARTRPHLSGWVLWDLCTATSADSSNMVCTSRRSRSSVSPNPMPELVSILCDHNILYDQSLFFSLPRRYVGKSPPASGARLHQHLRPSASRRNLRQAQGPRDDGKAAGDQLSTTPCHRERRPAGKIQVLVNYETTWYRSNRAAYDLSTTRHTWRDSQSRGARWPPRPRRKLMCSRNSSPGSMIPSSTARARSTISDATAPILMTWLMDGQPARVGHRGHQRIKPDILRRG